MYEFRGGSTWIVSGARAPINPEKYFVYLYRKYEKFIIYRDKHPINKKFNECFSSHYPPKAQSKLLDRILLTAPEHKYGRSGKKEGW